MDDNAPCHVIEISRKFGVKLVTICVNLLSEVHKLTASQARDWLNRSPTNFYDTEQFLKGKIYLYPLFNEASLIKYMWSQNNDTSVHETCVHVSVSRNFIS